MKYLDAKAANKESTKEDGTSHKMPKDAFGVANKMQPGTRADQGSAPISGMSNLTQAPSKVNASDAVRRLADELKVDVSSVKATGKGGTVTEADVRRTASENAAQTPKA